jgi:succinate-semialdehyde dehydrogenase/glutarate-semialdehyde dehydrogenase
MRATAHTLRNEAEALARLMAVEMGKPLRDGIAEVQKCAKDQLRHV